MTELSKIKHISQQIIDVISSMVKSEIILLDKNLKIIAGTGDYKKKIGSFCLYNQIYKELLNRKKSLVISHPGELDYCRACEKYRDCPKLFEIISPVLIENKIIGIITLLAYEKEEEQYLINEQDNLLNFLTYIGKLLVSNIIEQMMALKSRDLLDQLNAIFNTLESGIIATDSQGIITNVNQAVEGFINLKRSKLMACHINDIFPDSGLINVLHSGKKIKNKEIVYQTKNYSKRLILTANPVKDGVNIKGIVASIRGIGDLKKLVDDFCFNDQALHFNEIIGKSQPILELKKKAQRVANSSSSVLIRGESGTGKELFARAIHQTSTRRKQNFVAINCAAIPADLLESELFGYEAGAFTGAKGEGKPGKFELADKGTIFLDEIGDMGLHLQAKILKAIQDQKFYRIGGVKEINVDVRIISATNRNLEEMINEKKFREDLYYRLNVIPLGLPPLRERKEDILSLIKFFIEKYNKILHKNIKGLTIEAENILLSYNWPGNVRELENVIEYAINMELNSYINKDNLPTRMFSADLRGKEIKEKDLNDAIENLEEEMIIAVLNKYGWDTKGKYKAATELGIGKTTLYNKINKYNIKK